MYKIKGNNRKRYISFKIVSKEDILFNELIEEIQKKIMNYDKNIDFLRFKLIQFKKNCGIIRCAHTQKGHLIDILNSIDKINEKKVNVKTISTSGTIKSLNIKNN